MIDAIYGTGVRGPIQGFVGALIQEINAQAAQNQVPVFAIDLPSGVQADDGQVTGPAIVAEATLALQCLKIGHVLFPGADYCGEIFVADIGVSSLLPEIAQVRRELATAGSISSILAKHPGGADDHKGSRGHIVVIGGSAGRYGAPKMSAEAALRAGAGLVTLALPASAAAVVSSQLREPMCAALPDDGGGHFGAVSEGALRELITGKRAVVVGPGMGLTEGSAALLRQALSLTASLQIALVVDADGLTLIARDPALAKLLHPRCVLTPHPGEMARLSEISTQAVQDDRLGTAASYSAAHGCTVVLKGARTVIAEPSGALWINPAATAALATGGAGDVLAGMIGALAAHFDPLDAAKIAVFVHGCAGEVCEELRHGPSGTMAGDLFAHIPYLLNELRAQPPVHFHPVARALPGSLHDWLESDE